MARTVILFEDHTAQMFRPLSWSLPVHEIPWGMFNLRERLIRLLAQDLPEARLAYLPRGYLADLLGLTLGAEAAVGPDACAALDLDDVLFLTARLGPDWSRLRELVNGLEAGAAHVDAHGLIAWRASGDEARSALKSWGDWDAATRDEGAWSSFAGSARSWTCPNSVLEIERNDPAHLWDLIPHIGPAIEDDLAELRGPDSSGTIELPARRVFGALPTGKTPFPAGSLRRVDEAPSGVHLLGESGLWLGAAISLAPGAAIDTSHGPVVLDRGVRVLPHAYLEGPLYLGCAVRVKAGATIYGETAVGGMSRISGEIAESQLLPYMNKQHAGFLGHAVVGSWTNLGADTTNSDLKNNYGEIRVNFGLGPVDTGSRFVGLMMAEHAKSAIGTTFNTGTTVGFSSNVFAEGFPRTCLGNYTWGDGRVRRTYDVDRALEVARIVMGRRDCRFTDAHEALFRFLAV